MLLHVIDKSIRAGAKEQGVWGSNGPSTSRLTKCLKCLWTLDQLLGSSNITAAHEPTALCTQ
eukprot:964724-Pelagomonas_calceolata.AAC.1